jgi:hypothetical protein
MTTDESTLLEELDQPALPQSQEWELKNRPGWFRIKSDSGAIRFRSPGGVEISGRRYYELDSKFRGSIIPESLILPPPKKPPIFYPQASTGSRQQSNQTARNQFIENEKPPELPEAKPRPSSGKVAPGKATAKELADSFITTLLIATSLVALATRFDDLAMTETEAKNISIPLANILERSDVNTRFGRLIASSGDYQLLGYGIYLYLDRVTKAVNQRREQNAHTRTTASPNPTPTGGAGAPIGSPGPVSVNGVGANLPYSRTGSGGVTPITRVG